MSKTRKTMRRLSEYQDQGLSNQVCNKCQNEKLHNEVEKSNPGKRKPDLLDLVKTKQTRKAPLKRRMIDPRISPKMNPSTIPQCKDHQSLHFPPSFRNTHQGLLRLKLFLQSVCLFFFFYEKDNERIHWHIKRQAHKKGSSLYKKGLQLSRIVPTE